MPDNSTPMPAMDTFLTDPMFGVYTKMGEIETKVSNGVFENYKLQVAQTNDINNRAMQTAFHTMSALDALKQTVNDANTQNLLSAERLKSAVELSAAHTQEVVMQQGSVTDSIIGSINRENLSRELTDRATAIAALSGGYDGWVRDFAGVNGALQSANVASQVTALGSQLQSAGQGFVNTGVATDNTQTQTPTNIG